MFAKRGTLSPALQLMHGGTEEIMLAAPKLAAFLAVGGVLLLFVSTVLSSAHLDTLYLAEWTLDAAVVCFWLAVAVFLGYFFAGCVSEFRKIQ
ncbi:MAG: hypothetical protein ACM3IH_20040 [Sphingobacteriales bacterium]|jgi:hypothetical protein